MKNNKKIIINADDFGYTPGVTQGIIEAHNNGVVSSTTALSVSEYFMKAMDFARLTAPTLPIGVHLTLTLNNSKPILPIEEVPSLVDENGYFWNNKVFEEKVNLNEVYLEWEAQIIRFLKSGRRPDHMDSHHNVYGRNEDLFSIAIDLAKKFNLPLRNPSRDNKTDEGLDYYKDVKMPEKMLSSFYGERATSEQFLAILDDVVTSKEEVVELNCHPAFIDSVLVNTSSYCKERLDEVSILTSEGIKNALDQKGVLLTNYEILS